MFYYKYILPGTLQSSNINSAVLEPLMPILSNLGATLNPGIPYEHQILYSLSLS